MDFAYWWTYIGKGLRLQPELQARLFMDSARATRLKVILQHFESTEAFGIKLRDLLEFLL